MSLQPPTGNKPLRASQTKENSTSIPRLAAAVPKVTAVPSLIALPPELLLIVLGNLQDIGDLFSIILTCRYILDVFQIGEQSLIESIFSRYTRLETDRVIYEVLIQLKHIIQRNIIHRDVVRSIFEAGWKLFREKHREELLIPFGGALARSFVLNDRESDAIHLLRLIQKGVPPFGWSTGTLSRWSTSTPSQLPIQPIGELLKQLLAEENSDGTKHVYPDLDLPLVEIKRKSKQSASHIKLNDNERTTLLRDGILFRDQSIVVRYSRQPCLQKMHHFHRLFPLRPNNYVVNWDIGKILCHRPDNVLPTMYCHELRRQSIL